MFTTVNVRTFIVLCLMGLGVTSRHRLCAVCNQQIGSTSIWLRNKVTNEQKRVCDACILLSTSCYLCGLPVKNNMTRLDDGRILCARDAKDVVLSKARPGRPVWTPEMNWTRLFSRFHDFFPIPTPASPLSIGLKWINLCGHRVSIASVPRSMAYIRRPCCGRRALETSDQHPEWLAQVFA